MCGLESAKFLLSVHDQGCHGELSFLGGDRMKFFRQAKDFLSLLAEALVSKINAQAFQLNTRVLTK